MKAIHFHASALVLTFGVTAALADEIPQRVGACVETKITHLGTRLENTPGSGSAVAFTNGEAQVSYDQVEAVDQSRIGDPVRMCLVSIPKNCPKGDNRGSEYRTSNLRTHRSWQLPNSSHLCGGA